MKAMWRHYEVVKFCAGLMSDSTPLVEHMSELCIEGTLQVMRFCEYLTTHENLFESLYTESKMQLPGNALHNPLINCCEESDKTPIYIPSKFYVFYNMEKEVGCNNEHSREQREEIPECAVYIDMHLFLPAPAVAPSILHACQTICQKQKITNLWIFGLKCNDKKLTDVFLMSPNAQSLYVKYCDLPADVMIHQLKQLAHCRKLNRFLLLTSIGAAGHHLAQSIKSWGPSAPLQVLRL